VELADLSKAEDSCAEERNDCQASHLSMEAWNQERHCHDRHDADVINQDILHVAPVELHTILRDDFKKEGDDQQHQRLEGWKNSNDGADREEECSRVSKAANAGLLT